MRTSPLLKKYVTVLVSVVFFTTNGVLMPLAEANVWKERQKATKKDARLARLPAALPPVLPSSILKKHRYTNPYQSKTLSSKKRLPRFLAALPQQFGSIRNISKGSSEKIILHIQDIHQNHEAQTNISQTLQKLFQEEKVDLVALEGAFDSIDLAVFNNYPDQESVQRMADYFLKEGKISGPITAALTSGTKIPPIVGIDDATHYQANIEAYRASFPHQQRTKEKLAKIKADL
ncbi:hypothetical protein BVX98_05480, partial [bacterium F11]